MMRALSLFIVLLWTTASTAQVYRHVDENGNVSFTDQPPPNAEAVEIREPNTSAPPPAIPRYSRPSRDRGDDDEAYGYEVSITSPTNETIIPNGPGNFGVSATVSPGLEGTDQLQLLLNGSPHGAPQTGTSWALTNIFRGEQKLSIAVINGDGEQLATSDTVIVYVYRPSTNNRK